MELRSGTVIAAGYESADAARAACMGQARTQLPDEHKPAFAAAVRGALSRWTALRLAVENEWGGERSRELAAELEDSIINWFHAKGAFPPLCCARTSGSLDFVFRRREHPVVHNVPKQV
jgi:hypothetical protein